MWIDLSQDFWGEMPHSEALPPPEFETLRDVAEDRINVQFYGVPTHVGTHVDAPRHFVEGGPTIDELPLDRFAGEAVVLDASTDEAAAVTVADLEAAEAEVPGDDVGAGDIVLLHTGWGEKYGEADYDPHPWLAVESAEWLVDRGVGLLGCDVITPDIPGPHRPEGWMEFPVHRTLLGADVLIAEHLSLAPVAGERVEVQGFPMRIKGGDGAPARFVARR